MKYLKFTYVDAVTGVSVASHPASNGPVFPPVAGLEYAWARESQYPTEVPEFFGTCPDDSDTQIDGVLGVYLQADWETMREDEMRARNPVPASVSAAWIATDVPGYAGLNTFGLGSASVSYDSFANATISIKVKALV